MVLLVPLVVLGALPLILLKFGTGPITDPDTLWHIVAGRDLWSTWQFAGPDQLAEFTRLPFVYHQWLPELLMAGANAVAGLAGVAWLFNAMLLGFIVALYALCRGQGGILAALLATVAGWIGAGGSLSPRPQVFGFILLAVSLAAWLRTERDGRIRWWLLPLTWLWACVHGTWLYAVGLDGAVRRRHAAGPKGRAALRAPCGRPRRGPGGGGHAHAGRSSAAARSPRDLADQPVHQRVETDLDHRPPCRSHIAHGADRRGRVDPRSAASRVGRGYSFGPPGWRPP